MSRKKIDYDDPHAEIVFSHWLAQVIDMLQTKNLYLFGGRGLGKTSDIIAERAQNIVHDMPGAPLAFVGDTYANLFTNVIPNFLDGWRRKGWYHDDHYVTDKAPPEYFEQPYNIIMDYKHKMVTFNGANFTLVSLDRPSTGAGNSYVHLLGDEAKFQKFHKLKKLMPAVRGNKAKFGHSPFYRGHTFTSDLPNVDNNEDPWMLDKAKMMNRQQILEILRCAFVLNEVRHEYIQAEISGDEALLKNTAKKLERWEERWTKLRKDRIVKNPKSGKEERWSSTFYTVATSFVNVDILTADWFTEQLDALGLNEYKTAVVSLKASLERELLFYPRLSERHFYSDGIDYSIIDSHKLTDNIKFRSDSLKYINPNQKLEAGLDTGNMWSLPVGQEQWPYYYILKDFFILPPGWSRELADQFLDFFEPHRHKEIDLYFDRAANNYQQQKQDLAFKFKHAIENRQNPDGSYRKSGWKVNLMSRGQGDIPHQDEYNLMIEMLEEENKALPMLRIDKFAAKHVKSSMEMAPQEKDNKGLIRKVKKSEKLEPKRLPLESTNMSDGVKYLLCRQKYLSKVKRKKNVSFGDVSIRG